MALDADASFRPECGEEMGEGEEASPLFSVFFQKKGVRGGSSSQEEEGVPQGRFGGGGC